MAGLKWTQQALDDVDAITNYIARDSSFYAKMFARKILLMSQKLCCENVFVKECI